MSSFTNDMTVKSGPGIDVKKVSQATVSLPAFDPNQNSGADRKAPARTIANVGKQKDTVKPVMDQIMNPPHPREQMRGQQNSKNYKEDGSKFKSNMFTTGETAGG